MVTETSKKKAPWTGARARAALAGSTLLHVFGVIAIRLLFAARDGLLFLRARLVSLNADFIASGARAAMLPLELLLVASCWLAVALDSPDTRDGNDMKRLRSDFRAGAALGPGGHLSNLIFNNEPAQDGEPHLGVSAAKAQSSDLDLLSLYSGNPHAAVAAVSLSLERQPSPGFLGLLAGHEPLAPLSTASASHLPFAKLPESPSSDGGGNSYRSFGSGSSGMRLRRARGRSQQKGLSDREKQRAAQLWWKRRWIHHNKPTKPTKPNKRRDMRVAKKLRKANQAKAAEARAAERARLAALMSPEQLADAPVVRPRSKGLVMKWRSLAKSPAKSPAKGAASPKAQSPAQPSSKEVVVSAKSPSREVLVSAKSPSKEVESS